MNSLLNAADFNLNIGLIPLKMIFIGAAFVVIRKSLVSERPSWLLSCFAHRSS